jgi:hypothetical protein
MTTAYTSLLGLALPVTGELSGTWGDTVNNSITSLLDTSVAGTTNVSTDTDVTLTTTTGAANTARQAILLFSGARTALRTVTAPAQSKVYTVINATTGGFSVKLVGAGPTTGVTIVAGESAVCAWNGSDFVKVSNTSGSGTFTNLTVTGNLTVNSLTATRVPYASTSGLLVDSANMTFNGTTLTAGGLTSSGVLDVNGTTDSTSITTGSTVIDGGAGIAKSLFVGGNATITKDTATSFLRLQSLAPYSFPGDYTIQAGGQSTPALTIFDNTAGQERLNFLTGETVFNQPGADVDFRVESDTNTHALFVDAGNSTVGINTSTSLAGVDLVVNDVIRITGAAPELRVDVGSGGYYLQLTEEYAFPKSISHIRSVAGTSYEGQLQFSANIGGGSYIQLALMDSTFGTVFNEGSADLDFRVESDNRTHMLFVDAGTDQVIMGQSTPRTNATLTLSYWGSSAGNNAQLSIDANANSGTGQAVVELLAGSGSSSRASRINFLNGVTSTTVPRWTLINDYDQVGINDFRLINATAWSMMEFTQSGGVVFNEGSNDLDFRVESDTNTHALFLDAGNSRIGINNSSPTVAFDVSGSILASGGIQASSDLFVGGSATTSPVVLDRAIYINSITNNTTVGLNMYISEGSNNRRGAMFLNDSTGVFGFDTTASSGVPIYTFYRAGNDFFRIGDDIVANEIGGDIDFRVESDTSTHMLFVDAGTNTVNINTASPNSSAKLGVYSASGVNQVNWSINGNPQGSPQFAKVVRYVTSAGSSNKLVIPFLSQGNLNSTTVCRVMGHNAQYNLPAPQGFDFTFAVGHLNSLYSLASWGTGGNFSSIAINGMNVEITFTSAYGPIYGEAGGLFLTLEYMSNELAYSIQPNSIVLA